jgi:sugar (pentulose or hexulose) kinase
MSALPVIAIFDIGKTNKKFFLFDQQYQVVHETGTRLAETVDEDGFPTEDIEALVAWCRSCFKEAEERPQFNITAINFSAYGASLVHVDEAGEPLTPLYNYLKPYPEALQQQLYAANGGEAEFSVSTASPSLGSLNSGLQLYRLKHERPDIFARVHYSLHLPQYISSLFSGKFYSDLTSIGCHTGLWDFASNNYHQWVTKEGIDQKLAPIVPCDHTEMITVNGRQLLCGPGLHDSSAALIPYLTSNPEPFLLISTGTWCISLNPFNNAPLTAAELALDCLCYLSCKGTPVKAARIFAGHRHEEEVKKLSLHFSKDTNAFKQVSFDEASSNKARAQPASYDETPLSNYKDFAEAYHALMHDIILQQQISTSLVMSEGITRIFVDGGFANNQLYMNMLAKTFPAIAILPAEVPQASALGAALRLGVRF